MLAKCSDIRLLCLLLILGCQLSSSQFPQHVDFQKMGEVVFNNEKYNILRPSVHLIKDYFKDYMLRRENDSFPTKRIFIDDNGFRHFWSGFENTFANSRKTDTYIGDDVNTEDATIQKNRPRRKKPFDDSPEAMNILRNHIKNAALRAATTKKAAAATKKKTAAATTKKAAAATTKKTAAATTKKAAAATTKKTAAATTKKAAGASTTAKKGSGGGGKRLVITTFFCPFLGLLNMTSVIED